MRLLPLLPLVLLYVSSLALAANSALLEIEIAGPQGPPFNMSAPTLFGYSLALSPGDAQTVVVGSTPYDPTALGRAYILEENIASGWDLKATLAPPPDSRGGEGSFGTNVAIGVDVVVVSSSHAMTSTSNVGAVYVYRTNAQGWEARPSTVLVSPIPSVSCYFGSSITVLDNYIMIGCYTSTPSLGPISAYAFLYDLNNLAMPIATYTPTSPTDFTFGQEVALSDRFAFVASMERIYIFDRQNNSQMWNFSNNGYMPSSPPSARGDGLLVNWATKATLYRYIPTTNEWLEEVNFTSSSISSVALTDEFIYIGSGILPGITYSSGAVAVHSRTPLGGWSSKPTRTIAATNGQSDAQFGAEVHLSANGSVLVGSFGTSSFGSLYVYKPTKACGGALIDQELDQNAICNGTTLFYFDPIEITVPTVIATPIISIGDIKIDNSAITLIGGNFPFLTKACVSIDNSTLEIYLNYSPEDDMLFLTDTPCVNGSFNSITIQSRDCKQYTAIEQVQLREGFAVLLDTERSQCPSINLPAVIAGSVAGGILVISLIILGLIAYFAPQWLRCLTAPRRREKRGPVPEVYQT